MATIHRQQLSSLPVCWGGGRVPGGDLVPDSLRWEILLMFTRWT